MEKPRLFLCSLPIGNRGDISLNVLDCLKGGKIFVSEDTRTMKRIFHDYDIPLEDKKIISFHDQSSENDLNKIIEYFNGLEDIYYFSEAGSPVISDPGFPLVNLAKKMNIEIFTYPGACSVIAALELSGFPAIPFSFHGFFPRELGKISKIIDKLFYLGGTHIFYESPKRIENFLGILTGKKGTKFFPDEICLVREITKINQQIIFLNEINFENEIQKITFLGEFVILIRPKSNPFDVLNLLELEELCQEILEQGPNKKRLSKLISNITGEPVKKLYQKLN